MEHVTVQNIKDLPANGKRWLQDELGLDLKGNQQVFVMVYTAGVEPDEATRRQALARAECTMAEVQKNLTEQGVTEQEFDAAVDEAMEDVRRRQS